MHAAAASSSGCRKDVRRKSSTSRTGGNKQATDLEVSTVLRGGVLRGRVLRREERVLREIEACTEEVGVCTEGWGHVLREHQPHCKNI